MILIAIATGTGLQNKIREKIAALNGHIQIYNFDTNRSEVSVEPISTQQEFYPNFQFFNQSIKTGDNVTSGRNPFGSGTGF
mgnify:CR=1 FL=1